MPTSPVARRHSGRHQLRIVPLHDVFLSTNILAKPAYIVFKSVNYETPTWLVGWLVAALARLAPFSTLA